MRWDGLLDDPRTLNHISHFSRATQLGGFPPKGWMSVAVNFCACASTNDAVGSALRGHDEGAMALERSRVWRRLFPGGPSP